MGIRSELTQISQVKQLNIGSLQSVFNQMIQQSFFFIRSIVAGVKPQVKLLRYYYMIFSWKQGGRKASSKQKLEEREKQNEVRDLVSISSHG